MMMALHPFEQLEEAVLNVLAPLKFESPGLKTLGLYTGQMEVKELTDLIPQFPCIYVVTGGLEVQDSDNRGHGAEVGVMLLVGDQNRRGVRDALRGDEMSPGVYHLLGRSQDLLHGKTLIKGWRSLRVRREAPLIYAPTDNICLFEALYTTKF
jgi:phage gp37-like protein